jgi:hypothetical protein
VTAAKKPAARVEVPELVPGPDATTPGPGAPAGIEAILERKTARTETVTVVLDAEWGRAYETVMDQLRELDTSTADATQVGQLQAELDKLLATRDEAVTTFVFMSIPAHAYEALVAAHPPTPEQRARAVRDGVTRLWNHETFNPALLAATCASPAMTVEQAQRLVSDPAWNVVEVSALVNAAVNVCLERPQIRGWERPQTGG